MKHPEWRTLFLVHTKVTTEYCWAFKVDIKPLLLYLLFAYSAYSENLVRSACSLASFFVVSCWRDGFRAFEFNIFHVNIFSACVCPSTGCFLLPSTKWICIWLKTNESDIRNNRGKSNRFAKINLRQFGWLPFFFHSCMSLGSLWLLTMLRRSRSNCVLLL